MCIRDRFEATELCVDSLREGREVRVQGLLGGSRGLFISRVLDRWGRAIVVVPTEEELDCLVDDIGFFSGNERVIPMAVDPYGLQEPEREALRALLRFLEGEKAAIITTPEGLLLKVPSKEVLEALKLSLRVHQVIDRNWLIERLVELGYERVPMVETPGEMSVRGAILDLFPPERADPLRIEFFDNTIESIRTFDPHTQRSTAKLEHVVLWPAKLEGPNPLAREFADHLIVVEPEEVFERLKDFEPNPLFCAYGEIEGFLRDSPKVLLDGLWAESEGIRVEVQGHQGLREEVRAKGLKVLTFRIRDWFSRGHEVNIVISAEQQATRFSEILESYGIRGSPAGPKRGTVVGLSVGSLCRGFVLKKEGVVYLTETEIFGRKPRPSLRPKRGKLLDFDELKPGDYVVHVDYGIGIFLSLIHI